MRIAAKLIKAVFLLVVFSSIVYAEEQRNTPTAKNGFLDINNWNFEKSGYLELNGEWSFYWKELLNTEEIKKSKIKKNVYFPLTWNKLQKTYPELSSQGYATYKLTLLSSKPLENMALEIPDFLY